VALQVFGDTANAGTGLGENAVTGASGAVGHYLHGHLGNSVSMSLDELQGKKPFMRAADYTKDQRRKGEL